MEEDKSLKANISTCCWSNKVKHLLLKTTNSIVSPQADESEYYITVIYLGLFLSMYSETVRVDIF